MVNMRNIVYETPRTRGDVNTESLISAKAPTTVGFVYAADLHFGATPPVARASDQWDESQRRVLRQLAGLCRTYDCPLVLGGDIFHKWNEPLEVVNMVLAELPAQPCFAVAGNHDLCHRDFGAIDRTAFGTLVRAGRVTFLDAASPVSFGSFRLHGHSFGVTPVPLKLRHSLAIEVAVMHAYIWTNNKGAHIGAHESEYIREWRRRLGTYDLALFGDNHMTIQSLRRVGDGVSIFNPGSTMRRHVDQRDHRPCVGLIHNDGTIVPHYLDVSKDVLEERTLETAVSTDSSSVMQALDGLGDAALDFPSLVREKARLARESVQVIVNKAMDG